VEPKVGIEPTAYALPMKASFCVGTGARVDALSVFEREPKHHVA
jgi:hypothetical protein